MHRPCWSTGRLSTAVSSWPVETGSPGSRMEGSTPTEASAPTSGLLQGHGIDPRVRAFTGTDSEHRNSLPRLLSGRYPWRHSGGLRGDAQSADDTAWGDRCDAEYRRGGRVDQAKGWLPLWILGWPKDEEP